MSSYRFKLHDYHAIKEADIRIDGITVLAGENGSGKSTVARWLHKVVNVLNRYEELIVQDAEEEFTNLRHDLLRASSITPVLSREFRRHKFENRPFEGDALDELRERYNKDLSDFTELLSQKISPDDIAFNKERLASFFNIVSTADETVDDFIRNLQDVLQNQAEDRIRHYYKIRNSHRLDTLLNVIIDHSDPEVDDANISFEFEEDGVPLISEKGFNVPLMLRQSIYFDSQRMVSGLEHSVYDNDNDMRRFLHSSNNAATVKAKNLARVVKKIISGDVVLEKDTGAMFKRSNLHYVRQDGLNIYLKAAATGIISFSHLLRLLENGWLTEDTILILDEPEAHLHPQWIVDYARTLVLLNKHIGTKILLSSHNPDMVAAIQSIAAGESIIERTHFYLSERESADSMKYTFRHLGSEIAPIFDSFNIALDRIELYGGNQA